jgi:serine/threonine protein kinase
LPKRQITDALNLIGQVFDERYKVTSTLGRGGMGVVYRAVLDAGRQEVALKVLYRQYAEREEQLTRFSTELRACSKVSHPNIVRVLDYGRSAGGLLFIAMEYLKGETLARVLAREQKVTPLRTCRIVRQVCGALSAAHAKNVIHRDLKPDNVHLISMGGEPNFVKLLDFGVAKVLDGGPQGDYEMRAGYMCGTPHYISPEQALGKPLDGRADLYSLGVMLFEMLTGQNLFMADSPIGLVMKHIHDAPPDLAELAPECARTPELIDLVAQLLAKNAGDRPRSAYDVGRSLERIAEQLTSVDDRHAVAVGSGSPLHPQPRQVGRSPSAVSEEAVSSRKSDLETSVGSMSTGPLDVRSTQKITKEVAGRARLSHHDGIEPTRNGRPMAFLGLVFGLCMMTAAGGVYVGWRLTRSSADDERRVAQHRKALKSDGAEANNEAGQSSNDSQSKGEHTHHGAAAPSNADAPALQPIKLTSVPIGAKVVIRGKVVGETPYVFRPAPDQTATTVIVTNPGYLPESWRYVPGVRRPSGQNRVTIVLRPEPAQVGLPVGKEERPISTSPGEDRP